MKGSLNEASRYLENMGYDDSAIRIKGRNGVVMVSDVMIDFLQKIVGRDFIKDDQFSTDEALSIRSAAEHYGEVVKYQWRNPSGEDWIDGKGRITAAFLLEMERGTIQSVFTV